MIFASKCRPSCPIKSRATAIPANACFFLNVTENSSSSFLMHHPSKTRVILEGLYHIGLATAASLCIIGLLFLLSSCESPHAGDTPQKFDDYGNPNFGPKYEPLFHFSY